MKLTKTLIIAPMVIGSLIGSAFAADAAKTTTSTDTTATKTANADLSYSMGYMMGKSLQMQMKQINLKTESTSLESGLTDGVNGSKSKLTEDQMNVAMQSLQTQAMAAQNAMAAQKSAK